jgi:hypothetical protein
MSVTWTAPSYVNGQAVLVAYRAAYDDSAWTVVASAQLDAAPEDAAFDVLIVCRHPAMVPAGRRMHVNASPLTLAEAQSLAQMQADSLRERPPGSPGPLSA